MVKCNVCKRLVSCTLPLSYHDPYGREREINICQDCADNTASAFGRVLPEECTNCMFFMGATGCCRRFPTSIARNADAWCGEWREKV